MTEPDLGKLVTIMAQLRDPENGCPWDVEQDFVSIAPYTIEEAYEVADAIERNDMADLRDELGDLLLQVVFHSRMAEEDGAFDIQKVIDGISEKMIRRHPHVFGTEDADASEEVVANWETIKAEERAAKSDDNSFLAGVARSLPGLLRAQKLQKRAARSGFDWPDVEGPRSKVLEELDEVTAAPDQQSREEEIGDLLFAVVNLARFYKVDAEEALRAANSKFETRFRAMEHAAGESFAALSLEEKEELWQQAKAAAKGL